MTYGKGHNFSGIVSLNIPDRDPLGFISGRNMISGMEIICYIISLHEHSNSKPKDWSWGFFILAAKTSATPRWWHSLWLMAISFSDIAMPLHHLQINDNHVLFTQLKLLMHHSRLSDLSFTLSLKPSSCITDTQRPNLENTSYTYHTMSYTSVEGKKTKQHTTMQYDINFMPHIIHQCTQKRYKKSHLQPHLELLQRLLLSPRWRHATQTMGSVTRICLWVALFWGSNIWPIMTGRWYTLKNNSQFDDDSQHTEKQNMFQATNQNKHGWILSDIMCS